MRFGVVPHLEEPDASLCPLDELAERFGGIPDQTCVSRPTAAAAL